MSGSIRVPQIQMVTVDRGYIVAGADARRTSATRHAPIHRKALPNVWITWILVTREQFPFHVEGKIDTSLLQAAAKIHCCAWRATISPLLHQNFEVSRVKQQPISPLPIDNSPIHSGLCHARLKRSEILLGRHSG
jgi:hypothetical protein